LSDHNAWGTRRSWVSTLALAITLVACDAQTHRPARKESLDARPFVTQGALAALNSDGRFDTELPNGLPYPTIDATYARAIALAAAHTFGPGSKFLEEERGGPIDFSTLQPGRVFYGHSAYEQDLPADVAGGYRKAAGPFYLVTLTSRGQPVMSVAVSVYDTDIGIENGQIRMLSKRHGMDFTLHGIPAADAHDLPLSPERAVQVAAEQTGARVADVPHLQLLGVKLSAPHYGRWRLRLDRKVQFLHPTTGQVIETDEVFVGRDATAARAEASPLPPDRSFDSDSNQWIEFRFKTGVPSSGSSFSVARTN
jgi:hypothetical protein